MKKKYSLGISVESQPTATQSIKDTVIKPPKQLSQNHILSMLNKLFTPPVTVHAGGICVFTVP